MANLSGPRPLGNSIEAMDIGFALQARCLERVVQGGLGEAACVVPVPRDIDARVAGSIWEWRMDSGVGCGGVSEDVGGEWG